MADRFLHIDRKFHPWLTALWAVQFALLILEGSGIHFGLTLGGEHFIAREANMHLAVLAACGLFVLTSAALVGARFQRGASTATTTSKDLKPVS